MTDSPNPLLKQAETPAANFLSALSSMAQEMNPQSAAAGAVSQIDRAPANVRVTVPQITLSKPPQAVVPNGASRTNGVVSREILAAAAGNEAHTSADGNSGATSRPANTNRDEKPQTGTVASAVPVASLSIATPTVQPIAAASVPVVNNEAPTSSAADPAATPEPAITNFDALPRSGAFAAAVPVVPSTTAVPEVQPNAVANVSDAVANVPAFDNEARTGSVANPAATPDLAITNLDVLPRSGVLAAEVPVVPSATAAPEVQPNAAANAPVADGAKTGTSLSDVSKEDDPAIGAEPRSAVAGTTAALPASGDPSAAPADAKRVAPEANKGVQSLPSGGTDSATNASATTATATTTNPAAAIAATAPQNAVVLAGLPNAIVLPDFPALPQAVNPGEKTVQSKSSTEPFAPTSAAAATPDKNNAPGSASGAQSAGSQTTSTQPAQSAPAGNQPAQHTQADSSQPAPDAAKAADTMPIQTAGQAAQAPHADSADGRTRTPEGASAPLPVPAEAAETPATGGINTAKLIQSLSETEMHVGMRSVEFGDISIRTSVSPQLVLAQISVDHSDLGRALAAHVGNLETKLGETIGVRASIEVSHNGMAFSGERGSAAQQQSRSFAQVATVESAVVVPEPDTPGLHLAAMASGGARLDIRA